MAVVAALFGLLLGSFANVLVARVPAGEQWVKGSSRCPRCRHDLAWYDNVPLISWLALRGRCRHCAVPIPARYPIVELLVAALCGIAVAVFGVSVLSAGLMYMAMITVALSAIDLEHRRLPDVLTLSSYPVVVCVVMAQAWIDVEPWMLMRALFGGLIVGGFYFVMWFAYPKGMGFGDVKAAGVLGLLLGAVGWPAVAVGAIAGPLLGGVVGIVAMIKLRQKRGVTIPYGPWLIAGAWLGLLAGDAIGSGYTTLVIDGLS